MTNKFAVSFIALGVAVATAGANHPVRFDIRLLAIDGNEGCDIADIDGDGKLDVVAGRNWYRNGQWVPRAVRIIEDNNGYARSNGEWAYDVNGDGRPDILRPGAWYEAPADLRKGK